MATAIPVQRQNVHDRHAQLDTFLLYLLAAELGYFILLMIAGIVMSVLVYISDFAIPDRILNDYASSFLWPVLPYIVAFPLNLVGGLARLVLTIRTGYKDYPGSGHMVNWLFLLTTAWIFLITILLLLPGVAGSY